jgi:mRNA interferase HigB
MVIVGRERIDKFTRKHADARNWFSAWVADVERARWKTPAEIKALYPSASVLSRNRMIFNVKGNSYRMETAVGYETGVVIVRRVGTHKEYDSWPL